VRAASIIHTVPEVCPTRWTAGSYVKNPVELSFPELAVVVLGLALLVALTPFATGLVGIPVLYVVFQPVHGWLARRTSPRISAALVVVITLFLFVVPGVSLAGLIIAQAQQIVSGVVTSPMLARVAQLHIRNVAIGPHLADLGGKVVSRIGSSAFGLIGTATRLALNLLISLFGLYYLLLNPDEMRSALRPYIPFSSRNTEVLRTRFRSVTISTVVGTGLGGLIQGVGIGLGFWVAGLSNALFWGVVTGVSQSCPWWGAVSCGDRARSPWRWADAGARRSRWHSEGFWLPTWWTTSYDPSSSATGRTSIRW